MGLTVREQPLTPAAQKIAEIATPYLGAEGALGAAVVAGGGMSRIGGGAPKAPGAPLPSRVPAAPPRSALPDIGDLPHPRDGANVDDWAKAVAARHPTLTSAEVRSLYRYTTDAGYVEMNSFLRDPDRFDPDAAVRIRQDCDDAVAGMSKLPTREGIIYRGTNMPQQVLDEWKTVGTQVSDPAFWSTSTSSRVAQGFRGDGNALVEIESIHGVDIRALSHYGLEAEMLLPPGTVLEVISQVEVPGGGYWRLQAQEVMR